MEIPDCESEAIDLDSNMEANKWWKKQTVSVVSDFEVKIPARTVVLRWNMNTPAGPVAMNILTEYAWHHCNIPLVWGCVVIYIPAITLLSHPGK